MFNIRIKELRCAKGITQVELASQLGVTKQCISNWENDNIQPSIDMLMRTAQLFRVSTDYLLGLTDEQPLIVTGLTQTQIAHIQYIINDILETTDNCGHKTVSNI